MTHHSWVIITLQRHNLLEAPKMADADWCWYIASFDWTLAQSIQHSDWFEIQIRNLLVESLDNYLCHVTPLSAIRLDDFGCKLRGLDENRDLLDSNWLDIVHEVAPYCSLDGQDGDDSLEGKLSSWIDRCIVIGSIASLLGHIHFRRSFGHSLVDLQPFDPLRSFEVELWIRHDRLVVLSNRILIFLLGHGFRILPMPISSRVVPRKNFRIMSFGVKVGQIKGQSWIITLVLQMHPLTKLRQACKRATTASKIPNIDWSSLVALSHKKINAHSQQRKTVKVPVQSNDDLK